MPKRFYTSRIQTTVTMFYILRKHVERWGRR